MEKFFKEKKMKRLIIFLSTIGLFISVNAFGVAVSNTPVSAIPVNQLVTVPMQKAGFQVGVDALYYQPSSSYLDYAVKWGCNKKCLASISLGF